MITDNELAAMIELAETNEGMRDLLTQVKTYWLLAQSTSDAGPEIDHYAMFKELYTDLSTSPEWQQCIDALREL